MKTQKEFESLMEKIASQMYSKGSSDEDVRVALDWVNNHFINCQLISLIDGDKLAIVDIKNGEPVFKNTDKGNEIVEDLLNQRSFDE